MSLLELFVSVDDFCQIFMPAWEALCVYNSETTLPNNLESRAEEQTRCLRTQMVV